MKATGAEIYEFYKAWPMGEEWYHDDCEIEILGGEHEETNLLNAAALYDLGEFGIVCWQGQGEPPAKPPYGWTFESAYKKWKKDKSTLVFAVEIPKSDSGFFETVCQNRKWKVLK